MYIYIFILQKKTIYIYIISIMTKMCVMLKMASTVHPEAITNRKHRRKPRCFGWGSRRCWSRGIRVRENHIVWLIVIVWVYGHLWPTKMGFDFDLDFDLDHLWPWKVLISHETLAAPYFDKIRRVSECGTHRNPPMECAYGRPMFNDGKHEVWNRWMIGVPHIWTNLCNGQRRRYHIDKLHK